METGGGSRVGRATLAALALAAAATPPSLRGQDEITYVRDVATIVQAKCQACHGEASTASVRLTSYDDVRSYSREIGRAVAEGRMPPWPIDRTVGVRAFTGDRGLSERERETILDWVDGGTPYGERGEVPPSATVPDPTAFQLVDSLGPPDVVIRSRPLGPQAALTHGRLESSLPVGLEEGAWVRAVEIRPVGPTAVTAIHHAVAFVQQSEPGAEGAADAVGTGAAMGHPGLLLDWSVGRPGVVYPSGSGRLLLPGARIAWEVHPAEPRADTAPVDAADPAALELGIWLHAADTPPGHRIRSVLFDAGGPTGLDIPPGEVAVTQQYHTLRRPTRVEGFHPHMHMRGRTLQVEAVLPDGRTEVLSRVDGFRWNWRVGYTYAPAARPLLPAGTQLIVTAWHDNTAGNPDNPDHRQWVGRGDRPVDEMAHVWLELTYLTEDELEAAVTGRRSANDPRAPS